MAASGKPEEGLKLESGWLCLDFANTAEWHLSDHPTEHLASYAELIAWARSINLLPDRTAQQLLRAAGQHPAEAARVRKRAGSATNRSAPRISSLRITRSSKAR